jgi:hypothetical protein
MLFVAKVKAHRRFEVLVVEDDSKWGLALKQMYEEILDEADVKSYVSYQEQGREAWMNLQTLMPDQIHLLSLDINLGKTHPIKEGRPDKGLKGANGYDILKFAASKHVCRAIILITGASNDPSIEDVITKEGELDPILMSPEDCLKALSFPPDRYKVLHKASQRAIEDHLVQFKTILTKEVLLHLGRPTNEFFQEADGNWRVTYERKTTKIPESGGMKFIQHLLAYQNQSMSARAVRELIRPESDEPGTEEWKQIGEMKQEGLKIGVPSKVQMKGDDRSISERSARLDELKSEISTIAKQVTEAREFGSTSEIERLLAKLGDREDEYRWIQEDVGTGHAKTSVSDSKNIAEVEPEPSSGRHRTPAEQEVDTLKTAIIRALKKIEKHHPELHGHLKQPRGALDFNEALKLGFGYYPGREIDWYLGE